MPDDKSYMQRAIDLGWLGLGRNSPNPLVGSVIVRDGKIVGEGAHLYEKIDHAEVIAIRQAGEKAKGATAYVSLEPCSHQGRTPPCTDAIIAAGISRVVYGLTDPDPRVHGNGHALLERAGIKVEGGLLADQVREQNKFYVTAKEKNRPYVLLKWAMTADGKIATRTGESKWITSDRSRNVAQHLRNIYDGVLIGHITALIDNPRLTCRVDLSQPIPTELFPKAPEDIRHPVRVILDTFSSTLGRSPDLFSQPGKTIVAIGPECEWDDAKSCDTIDSEKVELIECPVTGGLIDLSYLLTELKNRNIFSLMVEGGGGVHASFLGAGLVDEIVFGVAPKIFGGEGAPGPVGGGGVEYIKDAWHFDDVRHFSVGEDMWMTGRIGKQ
jgi:diaminohydroxyphosphoribosylaminopyrimidine deaminase/5-amino-6-(5-phosphoribosylamino)uracil reductase